MNMTHCRWFAFGVAAGAAAGLLSAPRPGSRNRAMIARKTRRAADAVREAVDRSKDMLDRTQENVAAVVEAGRKIFPV